MSRTIQAIVQMAFYTVAIMAVVLIPHAIAYALVP